MDPACHRTADGAFRARRRNGVCGWASPGSTGVNSIIVAGSGGLATAIIEGLWSAGARIVRLADGDVDDISANLADAGVAEAVAIVCAGDDDAMNLEIALLSREANPDIRVVARVANDVLREALADDNGPGAILDVAELVSSSIVEACLARTTHVFEAADIKFVVSGVA